MSTEATVSFIICTRNRADSLRETLASVGRLRVPQGLAAELLVVDNGSSDHTREVVEQAGLANVPVRYVFEPQKGLSNARNRAIAESTGDILLWTDDDVRVPEDWIEGMCRPILNGEADAVAGGVRLAPELERGWMTPFHKAWLACTDGQDQHEPQGLTGANMAFSRAVLDRVPGFDPSLGAGGLGYGEDTLFSWQLERAGFRVAARLTSPSCVVEHHFDASRLARRCWLQDAVKRGRSAAYIFYHWEHKDSPNAARNLPRATARLWLGRLRNLPVLLEREGAPEWEILRLQEIAFYRQFLQESKKMRLYEPFGLVKQCAM